MTKTTPAQKAIEQITNGSQPKDYPGALMVAQTEIAHLLKRIDAANLRCDNMERERDAARISGHDAVEILEREICESNDQCAKLRGDVSRLVAERDQLREFLQDLHAFVIFAFDQKIPAGQICATIGHDIGGTLRGESCFAPRVSGFAKKQLPVG